MPDKLITWHNSFSVGIQLLDDQHKDLIKIINGLYNHVVGDEKQEFAYFQKIIHEITNYVKVHFADEEKILIATKFPGYTEHKKAHDSFIMAVINNIQDFQSGKRLTLSSFTHFLKDWVLGHIAVMDKHYYEYFKTIGHHNADGTLSIPHFADGE